jgi:alpha-1,3-glucan synthase
MRAKSAKQRFPVAQWVEDLNILQSTAIRVHNEEKSHHRPGSSAGNRLSRSFFSHSTDRLSMYGDATAQADAFVAPEDRRDRSPSGLNRTLSLGVRTGPGHRTRVVGQAPVIEVDEDETTAADEEYEISREQAEQIMVDEERGRALSNLESSSYPDSLRIGPRQPEQSFDGDTRGRSRGRSLSPAPGLSLRNSRSPDDRARSTSPSAGDSLLRAMTTRRPRLGPRPQSSVLDLNDIKGGKTDFKLQKVDPTFNDTTGEYYKAFEAMLQSMSGKNSEKELCIEEYLVESEKAWFKKFREAKLGKHAHGSSPDLSRGISPAPSTGSGHRRSGAYDQSLYDEDPRHSSDDERAYDGESVMDEFLLGKDYQRPSVLKRVLQWRIGDWPIYSLMLALGQIMAANSFQITLLTGNQGSTPEKLYIVGGIYMVTSCIWWLMYRSFRSLYVLSLPFIVYGLAFFLIGFAPFLGPGTGRDWMRNVATGLYTMASASGSIYFALNFGDEGKFSWSPPRNLHILTSF